MRILALEPFYGGSHRAFLDGWIEHSQHQFTVLGLPAHKWKWRMRHAAVTLAARLQQTPLNEQNFDVLWCSDMLNLAEFVGLASPEIRKLPRIVYFHENQLTYPVREDRERDLHFAYSNFTSCVSADYVWFNTDFHRQSFSVALATYLARMPDHQHLELVELIEDKSSIHHPGVHPFPDVLCRQPGPLRIAWNARWEHDKNPDDFFAALRVLKSQGVPFELIVLGQSFRNSPAVFASAQREFFAETLHWGYAQDVDEYRRLLARADVVVSTANHEFFGIAIVEAMAAGAIPLVPDRLAYPEVLKCCKLPVPMNAMLYGQTVSHLVSSLRESLEWIARPKIRAAMQDGMSRFAWKQRAAEMDQHLRVSCGIRTNCANGG